MTVRNPRADQILAAALQLPAAERQVYLDQACGDGELRRQVEGLLAEHARSGNFVDRPARGRAPSNQGNTLTTRHETPAPCPELPGGAGLSPVSPQPNRERGVGSAEGGELPARYRLEEEIARGGMGCVLRGRDTDLGREIAVKVLLEKHQGDAGLIQRFVEEAQIAGQLQHPGITPVYDMGGKSGNRPYFTMKLVKGLTLATLLAQRSDPEQDRPRYLKVFEQVCQTLAYAHAHNVIHRDLKPANIMVGAFGEVQVMDWGLAKVLEPGTEEKAETEEEPGSVITTIRSSDDGTELTLAGSVMGTPAYMAPEQARGEVARVDERADVFGLGAILCEILTGRPPFTGKSAEAMRQARKADLTDARDRLDRCGADAELVRLTRCCLAADPTDRPGNAGVLAAAVTAYLETVQERLRQAEVARAAEQARAEEARATAAAADARARAERQARRLTAALAASVLITVLLGGGGYVWVQQQRVEQRAVRARAVEEALEKAAELRGRAAAAPVGELSGWSEAQAELRRAEDLLVQGETDPKLQARVAAARDGLQSGLDRARRKADEAAAERRLVARLEAIRGETSEHFDPKRTDRAYAEAFRAFGLDLEVIEPREAGARLAGRATTTEVAAILDEWSWLRRDVEGKNPPSWQRLVAVARAADPDPWRNRLRATLGRPFAAAAAALRKQADDVAALERQPAASLVLLARLLQSAGERERSTAVLRIGWRLFPGDFWVNFELGQSSWTRGRHDRPEDAVRFLTAAVAARPGSAPTYINLGNALGKQGKWDEAVAAYRQAVKLDSKNAHAHNNLGLALEAQEKWDEAVAAYRRAITLDPKLASAHDNLSLTLHKQGKLDEAVAAYRQAITLDPKNAAAYRNLGVALDAQGKLDEAVAAYCQALDLLRPGDPLHPRVSQQLQECRRSLELQKKLPDFLAGKVRPVAPREQIDYAKLCGRSKRYRTSAQLYAQAFSTDPMLADDLQLGHRYDAACCAALAAAGQGGDAAGVDDVGRRRWRRQALTWLRAELAARTRQLQSDKPADRTEASQTMKHWMGDRDLAGLRDKAVAKLPAEEQKACRTFWADVEALLQQAEKEK